MTDTCGSSMKQLLKPIFMQSGQQAVANVRNKATAFSAATSITSSVGMYSHQMIHVVLIEVTVDDQLPLSGQSHRFCLALLKQRGSRWGCE
jgi:hypothetical protein